MKLKTDVVLYDFVSQPYQNVDQLLKKIPSNQTGETSVRHCWMSLVIANALNDTYTKIDINILLLTIQDHETTV